MKHKAEKIFFAIFSIIALGLAFVAITEEDTYTLYDRQSVATELIDYNPEPIYELNKVDQALLANKIIDPFSLYNPKVRPRKNRPKEKPKEPALTPIVVAPKPKPPPPKPRIVPFDFIGISRDGEHLHAPVVILRMKDLGDNADYHEMGPGEILSGYKLKSIKGEMVIFIDPDGVLLTFDNGVLLK